MADFSSPSFDALPAIRPDPIQPDPEDARRWQFVRELWESQTWALQARDRQIEENVRMLSGQQWHVYSPLLGKWVDISTVLDDYERRWRQRPTVNRLLYWFMLTHARMTENPPVVAFQPSTGDRADAQLAEVMDTIWKSLWTELEMVEVLDRAFAWLIPGGTVYLKSRIDTEKGDFREFVDEGVLDYEGEPRLMEAVPYDEQGEMLAELTEDGRGYRATGEPFRTREGSLAVDVLAPVECRGEWGPMPWHKKSWHLHRSLLTPGQVRSIWGIDEVPDTHGSASHGSGQIERLLFGSGYFGGAENMPYAAGSTTSETGGLITIYELWLKPSSDSPATPTSPGGRLLVVTGSGNVAFDGVRPFRCKGTSPIQELRFVDLPGRPSGTTPQEMLNPIQRTYNRGVAQLLEHRNLVTNPIAILDDLSGLEEEQIHNRPGAILRVNRRDGITPLEYVQPPRISDDVWKMQEVLADEMGFLGNLEGSQGTPPTRDASGELVKELRFNQDRFIGPTMRRAVHTMRRVCEDWMAMLPLIWDEEKIISYAGEDSVVRTATVLPEMFEEGNVNVMVDIESMLPEGRGERQSRVFRMYVDGLLGPPGSPEARKQFYDMARFPHMNRSLKPGGIDRITAEQENGKLVQGHPADSIPVLEWYLHEVHVEVHREFMASPEFVRLDVEIQTQFMRHYQVHQQVLQMQMQAQLEMEMAMAAGPEGAGGPAPADEGAALSSNGGPSSQRFTPETAQEGDHIARGGRKMQFPGFTGGAE